MNFTGRPVMRAIIAAMVAVLTSKNLAPKLPPEGWGCRSSLLLGTRRVLASRNRKCVNDMEFTWMVIIPVAAS